ncbi:hypothetical protein EB001_13280 [bacterium]|nr:hypothetical protein [bacterium]
MVYTKKPTPKLTPTQIRENLIEQKKKELAEIQSMIDLVKHYIRLKEQEELDKKELRDFKFIVKLDDDDAIGPSISLTQLFPSAKLQVTKKRVQPSWVDIEEEDDGKFFETYRPVFD